MCNICYKIKNNWWRNNNKIRHLEKETTKDILNFYKEVIKWIKKELNKKSVSSLSNNIQKIVNDAVKNTWITDNIIKNFLTSAKTWNSYVNRTMNFWIWFDRIEETMQRYFQWIIDEFTPTETWDNIVSNMIRNIKLISAEWAQEWLSASLIWRRISESTSLSVHRANTIAIREIWIWYEKWKEETINWYLSENPWKKVFKKWVTVWDSRVTPSHTQNEKDGWILKDQSFSW